MSSHAAKTKIPVQKAMASDDSTPECVTAVPVTKRMDGQNHPAVMARKDNPALLSMGTIVAVAGLRGYGVAGRTGCGERRAGKKSCHPEAGRGCGGAKDLLIHSRSSRCADPARTSRSFAPHSPSLLSYKDDKSFSR